VKAKDKKKYKKDKRKRRKKRGGRGNTCHLCLSKHGFEVRHSQCCSTDMLISYCFKILINMREEREGGGQERDGISVLLLFRFFHSCSCSAWM
jgi:hypothetical protein